MSVERIEARWIVTGVDADGIAQVIDHAALVHDDGLILAVGAREDMLARWPDAAVKSFASHVLMPGFVNAHHHVGLTPTQLGAHDVALELWFATRLAARDVDPHLDALYSAFEMIASGVTCVQHLQSRIAGSGEDVHAGSTAVLAAYRQVGLRVSYSYAFREQNRLVYEDDAVFCASLPGELGERLATQLRRHTLGLDEQMQVYSSLRDDCVDDARIRIQLAPASLHWMTDDGLSSMAERARDDGVPMHMHLLETPYQREYARRRTGTTAVRHLERLGILGPSLTLGHAVWVDDDDIDCLAASGTCICHNCSSNLRLRSGRAPLTALASRGMTIGLGIDEAGINDDRDMLQELRLALRVHRTPGFDDADVPSPASMFRMATEHGAATTPFKGSIGRLDSGMRCDAVAIDHAAATWPFQDEALPLLDTVLLRAKSQHVDTVFVDGEVIYSQGRFTHVDCDAVMNEIAARMSVPRSRAEIERVQLSSDVLPHVRTFYEHYLTGRETQKANA
ncbi:amidohydrolase [soil metagenome]